MDIGNHKNREIRCIRNDTEVMGEFRWNNVLEVGRVYHMTDIMVYSWYTEVHLKEFPGFWFNSVLFTEMDEEEMKDANN